MSINLKSINGITENTVKRLLLDAGAFYKNFDPATDTVETAKGKLLGATKGGGGFKAIPSYRTIEVDGSRGKIKGMEILDSWDISISAKIVETTPEIIMAALGASTQNTTQAPQKYTKIEGKQVLELSYYIDNITWVGNLSGSNKPVIIQVFNALSQKGLELGLEDKSESVIELEFSGFYNSDNLDTPPFAIYYPEVR